MYQCIEITGLNDPALSVYTRLTDAQLRNRRRPEQGLFIAEGAKVIACALDAGCEPVSLLMERRQLEPQAGLLARCGEVPVYTADRAVLAELTGFALTRGFLCAMRRPAPRTDGSVCAGAARIAVPVGVTDPTNVGAIFRSASALGMDAVLLGPGCCDPLHRRAARVSMGAVFQIPWAYLSLPEGGGAEAVPARLRALGFFTAALTPDERAVPVDDPRLRSAPRLALLPGSEGDGLSPSLMAACDCMAKIPMSHGTDSLNVAAAAAVAFWAVRRQD